MDRCSIVVGVVPGQPPGVVATAASYAERFGADLVLASVRNHRYLVGDGTGVSIPIDPALLTDQDPEFDPDLRAAIAEKLQGRDLDWSVRALSGDPAQALSSLADELDAAMIVIGTRAPGIRESLREFLSGSVAVQLAHSQHRPLVVVPLDPVGVADLPWEPDAQE